MNLILPVAKQDAALTDEQVDALVAEQLAPHRFYLLVKQYGVKKQIGSIFVPESAVDAQEWTHGLGVVLRVGPSVYRGRRFEEINLGPDDGPKAGDIVMFEARQPKRFRFHGHTYFLLPDDACTITVAPEAADHVSFKF